MSVPLKIIFWLVSLSVISACSLKNPTYEFSAAENVQQQQCFDHCAQILKFCKRLDRQQYQLCSMQRMMNRIQLSGCCGRAAPCFSSYSVCTTEQYQCNSDFRACYEQCGGTVTEIAPCEKDCDKNEAEAERDSESDNSQP